MTRISKFWSADSLVDDKLLQFYCLPQFPLSRTSLWTCVNPSAALQKPELGRDCTHGAACRSCARRVIGTIQSVKYLWPRYGNHFSYICLFQPSPCHLRAPPPSDRSDQLHWTLPLSKWNCALPWNFNSSAPEWRFFTVPYGSFPPARRYVGTGQLKVCDWSNYSNNKLSRHSSAEICQPWTPHHRQS